jgi:hypothetical protein
MVTTAGRTRATLSAREGVAVGVGGDKVGVGVGVDVCVGVGVRRGDARSASDATASHRDGSTFSAGVGAALSGKPLAHKTSPPPTMPPNRPPMENETVTRATIIHVVSDDRWDKKPDSVDVEEDFPFTCSILLVCWLLANSPQRQDFSRSS